MIDKVDRSVEQLIDEILVMDCQSGRVKALEILVTRWQKRLWRYAYGLTGNPEAAWEVTQESWLGIIKGLRKLQDPASFKAWAYRITTNKSKKTSMIPVMNQKKTQYGQWQGTFIVERCYPL